jgi:hypothetical protein
MNCGFALRRTQRAFVRLSLMILFGSRRSKPDRRLLHLCSPYCIGAILMRDAYITSVARKKLIGADASIPWYILLALLMPALYARAIGRGREILILPADPKRTHNQFATSLSRSATNAQQSSFYRGRAGCVPQSMIRITAPRGVMSRQTRVAELIIREPSVLCHHSTSLLVRDPALTTYGKLWTRLVG